jgi:hypothetical protein
MPDALSISKAHHGGDQFMRLPPERYKLHPQLICVRRLVKPLTIADQNLISPDYNGIQVGAGNPSSLQFSQQNSAVHGSHTISSCGDLDLRFIDICRARVEHQPTGQQQCTA